MSKVELCRLRSVPADAMLFLQLRRAQSIFKKTKTNKNKKKLRLIVKNSQKDEEKYMQFSKFVRLLLWKETFMKILTIPNDTSH